MSTNRKIFQAISIVLILSMLLSGFPLPSASAQGGDGVKRQVNAQSGRVSFIGPESGRELPAARALGLAHRPQDPGLALAKRFAPEFGIQNPERDLSEMKKNRSSDGRVTVRYQQTYQGVPVMGGELIVNTNEDGDLYSMSGEVSPDLSLQTQPTIDSAQAVDAVLQAMAKWYQASAEDFVATEPELWVFDESLLKQSDRPAELVWRLEATAKDNALPVRELALVNAEKGNISLHFNQIDTAWHATGKISGTGGSMTAALTPATPAVLGSPLVDTHTANHGTSLPGLLLCNETQPTCTGGINTHADKAHLYALGTYDLYATQHLRDSIDNAGMTIVSTVRYRNNYANAFWSGSQMVYGDAYGFPLADDVVAHELTHGVTQYESNLFYFYQSGAINESFSDLWGEYYDQTNGQGNDAAGVKWLVGENITGLGAIRSMKNPPQFGDPDKMTSPYYVTNVPYSYDYYWAPDSGGVHSNSGVNNKAVFLMVDGGAFNGKTVAALGWEKVGAIYYEVQTNLLASGSDYSDLYYALQQACVNLIGQHGIVAEDCAQVKKALDAVQMNSQPLPGFNPDAAYCPAGMETDPSLSLFADDFESGEGNWTRQNQFYHSSEYASSGVHMMYGNDGATNALSTLRLLPTVAIPTGKTFLRFEHAFGFEYFINSSGAYFWDGGLLEYSANGGAWKDAGALFSGGQNYTGAIVYYPYPGGNPLGGRSGFVGDSHGYVSSRFNLSSLAGKNVAFRWRMGTDEVFSYLGWVIDDVEIYTCVPIPPIPTLESPANTALLTNYAAPLLNWSNTLAGLDHYQVQVATDNTFAAPLYDDDTLAVSEFQFPADLTPDTQYFWRVRSLNYLNTARGWSKVFSFRAAILPPTLTAPDDAASLTHLRPFFDWDDVVGATGYKIALSANSNMSSPLFNVAAATSEFLPPADLPANTTLYWRVRAIGPNGPSLWSATRSLLTGNPPSIPNLVAPLENAPLKDYTPLFDWSNSTLPAGTTFKHYELQVDDNSDFSLPEINISTTEGVRTESSFTPLSPLASNTKYFWRVRAVNDVAGISHFSGWSAVRSFRAAMLPPTLLLPADTSTVTDTRKPLFDWDDVPGAATYKIQISTDAAFGTFLVNLTTPDATSAFTPAANLPNNTTLHWRVRANGPNGPSAWSKFSFTLQVP